MSPDLPQTDLDTAALAMAHDDTDRLALQFYKTLSQSTLFLLLQAEPEGADISPMVFDLPSGRVVLAFDSEDRLGAWAQEVGQGALPYAALPGRVLAELIAGQEGLALGLNFGAGTASEMVLPDQAMTWLVSMLDVAPAPQIEKIAQVLPMDAAPPTLLDTLTRGLAGAGALAQGAVLARVAYTGGAQAHVVAFFGVAEAAQPPLARAVAETLAFSGLEAAAIDVVFPPEGPTAQMLMQLGVPIPLPQPAPPEPAPSRPAPGMNKDAPPKLR